MIKPTETAISSQLDFALQDARKKREAIAARRNKNRALDTAISAAGALAPAAGGLIGLGVGGPAGAAVGSTIGQGLGAGADLARGAIGQKDDEELLAQAGLLNGLGSLLGMA